MTDLDKMIEDHGGPQFAIRYFWADGFACVSEAGEVATWRSLDGVTRAVNDLLGGVKESYAFRMVAESFGDQGSVPELQAASIVLMTAIATVKK